LIAGKTYRELEEKIKVEQAHVSVIDEEILFLQQTG
jgi:hypothetical protein